MPTIPHAPSSRFANAGALNGIDPNRSMTLRQATEDDVPVESSVSARKPVHPSERSKLHSELEPAPAEPAPAEPASAEPAPAEPAARVTHTKANVPVNIAPKEDPAKSDLPF